MAWDYRLDPETFHPSYPDSCETAFFTRGAQAEGLEGNPGPTQATNLTAPKSLLAPSEAEKDNLLNHGATIFQRLPFEVLDVILCYLSVPSLDAARFTCKAMWMLIMSNPYVLSSVLGQRFQAEKRKLAIAFDGAATLISTHGHPDAWRPRFRLHTISFRLSCDDSREEVNTAVIHRALDTAVKLSQGHFLVLHDRDVSSVASVAPSYDSSLLHFYRFESSDIPLYVGSAKSSQVQGFRKIEQATELRQNRAWRIKVEGPTNSRVYEITMRKAWPGGESPYIVRTLDGPCLPQQTPIPESYNDSTSEAIEPLKYGFKDTKILKLLARVPPDDVPLDCGTNKDTISPSYHESEISKQSEQISFSKILEGTTTTFFIAEHLVTKTLHLVGIESKQRFLSSDGSHFRARDQGVVVQGKSYDLATLHKPSDDDTYRNIAVAPNVVNDSRGKPIIRVAVIWQDKLSEHSKHGTIYTYEIPSVALEITEPSILVRGKRVSSIPAAFGGIHPKSSIHDLAHTSPDSHDLGLKSSLGGLQFAVRPTTPATWLAEWSKLYVWGPSPATQNLAVCREIELKIFDFSFASSARLAASRCHVAHPFELDPETTRPKCLMTGSRMENCCCRLHDKGWNVEIPDASTLGTQSGGESGRTTRSVFRGFSTPQEKEKPLQGSVGKIEQVDSPERQQALERTELWVKQRIVEMKKAGMSDDELRQSWFNAWWTGYGVLVKPRNWENEWHEWANE